MILDDMQGNGETILTWKLDINKGNNIGMALELGKSYAAGI